MKKSAKGSEEEEVDGHLGHLTHSLTNTHDFVWSVMFFYVGCVCARINQPLMPWSWCVCLRSMPSMMMVVVVVPCRFLPISSWLTRQLHCIVYLSFFEGDLCFSVQQTENDHFVVVYRGCLCVFNTEELLISLIQLSFCRGRKNREFFHQRMPANEKLFLVVDWVYQQQDNEASKCTLFCIFFLDDDDVPLNWVWMLLV